MWRYSGILKPLKMPGWAEPVGFVGMVMGVAGLLPAGSPLKESTDWLRLG
jgi:hypothetical protein